MADAHIGDTIADKEQPEALPTIDIEAPTLSMYLGPNTSPMKGREGEFTTSRQIGDRLKRELETKCRVTSRGKRNWLYDFWTWRIALKCFD